MALPIPQLDDITFDQLVEEAVRHIPILSTEWTDHNAHDPGITFIELFAWLAEAQIYQLDQISDDSCLRFLQLVGVSPQPLQPARVNIELTVPQQQAQDYLLKAGTKLAPVGKDEIIFETVRNQFLTSTQLQAVFSQNPDGSAVDRSEANNKADIDFPAFGEQAAAGSSLWLGFDRWFDGAAIHLYIELLESDLPAPGRFAGAPSQPSSSVQLVWEYYSEQGWQNLTLSEDRTYQLSTSGEIIFTNPGAEAAVPQQGLSRRKRFWIRARLRQGHYEIVPRIIKVRLNVAAALQIDTVTNEALGNGTGRPGHSVKLKKPPLIKTIHGDPLQTLDLGDILIDGQAWQQVDNFSQSGPADSHYMLTAGRGEITFGNGLNGRIPQPEQQIKACYRSSLGADGKLPAGQHWRIADPQLLGIRGSNWLPALHGKAAETLDEAKRRARHEFNSRNRAVTAADFEQLAKTTPGLRVARAKALMNYRPDFPGLNIPGSVTVVVVPYARKTEIKPQPGERFLDTIRQHLEKLRLLTTDLHVIAPDYVKVSVSGKIHLKRQSDPDAVKKRVDSALQGFLHPLRGGPDRSGWPLGRSVFPSEIYQLIDSVEGVDYIVDVELRSESASICRSTRLTRQGKGIALPRNGIVYSGNHRLEIITP